MTLRGLCGLGQKLVVAAAAAATVLGAIELYYRATYRPDWYVGGDFHPGEFPQVNADGFRDVDYGPKAHGSYRILLLGDSFTFGSGVADDRAIWPALLERRLQESRPLEGVDTYEILNAGIAGSLTHQWVAAYTQQRARFQPDLVLAVFFLRDGTQFEQGTAELVHAAKRRVARDPIAQRSMAYRYFLERRGAADIAGVLQGFFLASYAGSPEQTAEWRRAQGNLLALQALAASDGARYGLVGFPILYGLEHAIYPFQPIMETLAAFSVANDMPYLSLLPAFRGRRADEFWVSATNQHPNARAHAMAAAALLPFVQQLMTPAHLGARE
jgi:GDSL-like Lipase/Acylhydrolase family